MASDVQTPSYETEVDDNIAQVSQKIHLTDLGRGVLALACLLFGYLFLVSLLDLGMGGSDAWGPLTVRIVAFAIFLFGLAVLATRVVMRYLTSVNPYYAARQLEETIPGAKNSLINWLDLKDAPLLPPVIHQAVGMRAARDVAEADGDLVASSRDLWKLGAATGVFFLGLLILFAIVPRQFGSLLSRAIAPVRLSTLNARTAITILKPGNGDVVVPANQRVEFLARIEGNVPAPNTPGAPALLYRYTTNDVPVRVPLEEDINGQWGARLSGDQLRTGLFWKITAGDASTPEAQLRVRSQPFVTRYEATYIFRPYRKLPPTTMTMPNEAMPQPRIYGHRGTDVVLKARVNAPVKSGVLELDLQGTKKTLIAQLPESEPQTLVFRLGLEKSGTFRILFETPGGEPNVDRTPHAIDVFEDGAPTVELIEPGKDLVAPANGVVLLAGKAFDDFGVTVLSLRLQFAGQPNPRPLAPLPYVPKKKLQFDNGMYPVEVSYVDVLPLDQLRTPQGQPVALSAGDEITYWLEATDNMDFGYANVGKSKSYKVTIKDGLKPAEQQKLDRQQADKQKAEHDQQQSDDLNKQNKEQNEKGDQDKKQGSGGEGNSKDGKDPNSRNENPPKDKSPNNSDKGQDGAKNPPSPEEQQKKDLENELGKTADPVNQALNKNNQDKKNPDSPQEKNPEKNPGGNEQPKPKEDKSANPPDKGEGDGKDNAPKNDGGKQNDSGDKKGAEKDGGGDASNGGADKKKDAAASKGPGANKETAKSAPDKSKDDPGTKSEGKGNNADGDAKATDKIGDPNGPREKGKTSENGKLEPSKSKTPPENPTQAKGTDKETPNGQSTGQAKKNDDAPKDTQTKSDGKKGEAEATKDAPPNEKPMNPSLSKGNGAPENKNPPTKEEIEALKDLLKKGGPEADELAKALAKRGQDMEDGGLKDDLEKALKEAGREADLKTLAGGNRELAPPPQKAGEGAKQGAATKSGPGGGGVLEQLKKLTPEEAFARRMGDLQLDNLDELKKRVTPDVLKEAKVSPEEWQRFLDNAKKYQGLVKQIRERDDRFLKGGISKIGGGGLRSVQTDPNAKLNPEANGQGVPPPEFRDVYRDYTSKKKTP